MPGDLPLDRPFDPGTLPALRVVVRACARRAGMPDDRAMDVVLAVHELMANAIRHGAGKGRLRIWQDPGALHCQVDDEGALAPGNLSPPSSPPSPSNPIGPPAPGGTPDAGSPAGRWPVRHGHGLWVVRQVADDMEVLSGPGGTRATAIFALPSGQTPR